MSQICHETTSWVFGVMSSHNVTSLHHNQGCAQPGTVCQVACAHAKNMINTLYVTLYGYFGWVQSQY